MNILAIIDKKSKGNELTKEEIFFFVSEYTQDNIPDYQMSSLLMAIKSNGMTDEETVFLTEAYLNDSYKFEPKDDTFFDKHSTGGVGDKVSIALLPILGALGMKSLKFSGRGLGFTGGTLDKLESLKDIKVEFTNEEINEIIDKTGLIIASTTDDIVPADKKIYALRDVTGTVDSYPLIAASIMSKKIVSGSKHILIDMKVGTGAFMPDIESAKELGRLMKIIGNAFDRKVFIAMTTMDQPLGRMIGNGNEITEVVEIVKGKGVKDAHELITKLAAEIYSSLKEIEFEEAMKEVLEVMNNGKAYDKLEEMLEGQGADIISFRKEKYFEPKVVTFIKSKEAGYVSFKSSAEFGNLAIELKAGRHEKGDKLNHHNGFKLLAKHGDKVEQYDEIIEIYSSEELSTDFLEKVYNNFIFTEEKPKDIKVILDEIKW